VCAGSKAWAARIGDRATVPPQNEAPDGASWAIEGPLWPCGLPAGGERELAAFDLLEPRRLTLGIEVAKPITWYNRQRAVSHK
jgi:hypothetical protein